MKAVFFSVILLFYFQAQAYDFSPKSQAQSSKEAQRWSLSQWMEQKGKIKWMDVWLHSNSSSPSFYEIYLGGEHGTYDRTNVSTLGPLLTDDEFKSTAGHFGFYVGWFGLYGRYEQSGTSEEDRTVWDALAQVRLLGTSDQGSSLTAFYGLRQEEFLNDTVMNQQAGGAMTIYLLNPWAIQARYQHWLKEDSDNGNSIKGYRFEATTWLEWGAVRAFGTWFHEPTELTNSLGTLTTRREGVNVGLRIYLDFKK